MTVTNKLTHNKPIQTAMLCSTIHTLGPHTYYTYLTASFDQAAELISTGQMVKDQAVLYLQQPITMFPNIQHTPADVYPYIAINGNSDLDV